MWNVQRSVEAFILRGFNRSGIYIMREDLYEVLGVELPKKSDSYKKAMRKTSTFTSRKASFINTLHKDHEISLVWLSKEEGYYTLKAEEVAPFAIGRMEDEVSHSFEKAETLLGSVGEDRARRMNLQDQSKLKSIKELIEKRKDQW